jgi:hypothetical protein
MLCIMRCYMLMTMRCYIGVEFGVSSLTLSSTLPSLIACLDAIESCSSNNTDDTHYDDHNCDSENGSSNGNSNGARALGATLEVAMYILEGVQVLRQRALSSLSSSSSSAASSSTSSASPSSASSLSFLSSLPCRSYIMICSSGAPDYGPGAIASVSPTLTRSTMAAAGGVPMDVKQMNNNAIKYYHNIAMRAHINNTCGIVFIHAIMSPNDTS